MATTNVPRGAANGSQARKTTSSMGDFASSLERSVGPLPERHPGLDSGVIQRTENRSASRAHA
ncbi:hypothetical protein [Streptomyces lannensis]|uniref:Uncharacterized protein n=1 Tax=Streptomyces lannensis TaxID=766498 RepID=A0ABP7LX95_9ACTN